MAEVYRGTQRGAEGFSKTVAVKRVLPGYSNDPQFAEMFVAEATIASRLTHPNVVTVTDFDRDTEGRLFLVMELVEGKDLRAVMATGRLPLPIVVYVIGELLRALGYAHALLHEGRPMKIVHRDVSPHNVLVSWDGAVKLSDFGIAKAAEASPSTRTGVVKGKAAYLSPEQARAEDLDHRSDLFAAGVMLHELLTNRRLFAVEGGAREAVIIHRVLNMAVPSPRATFDDISPELDGVCTWLLARDRAARPADAFEALDALLACPEASARGARELATLMKERFPREAPSLTTHAYSGPVYETPKKPPVGDFTDSAIDRREIAHDLASVAVDPIALRAAAAEIRTNTAETDSTRQRPDTTRDPPIALGVAGIQSSVPRGGTPDPGTGAVRGALDSEGAAHGARGGVEAPASRGGEIESGGGSGVSDVGGRDAIRTEAPRGDRAPEASGLVSDSDGSAQVEAPEPTAPSGPRPERISGPTVVRTAQASPESNRWGSRADTSPTAAGSLVPGTLADAAPTRQTPAVTRPPRRASWWWSAIVVLTTLIGALVYLNLRPSAGPDASTPSEASQTSRGGDTLDRVPEEHRDVTASPNEVEPEPPVPASAGENETSATEPPVPATAADAARPRRDASDQAKAQKRRRRAPVPAPPATEPEPKPKKVGDDLLPPDL